MAKPSTLPVSVPPSPEAPSLAALSSIRFYLHVNFNNKPWILFLTQSETCSRARGAFCELWLPTYMSKEAAQHNAHFFGTRFDKPVRRKGSQHKTLDGECAVVASLFSGLIQCFTTVRASTFSSSTKLSTRLVPA